MPDMYVCGRCFRANGLYPLPLEDNTTDARERYGCRYCGWKGVPVIVTFSGQRPSPSQIKRRKTPLREMP